MISTNKKIFLGSNSPRRKELLQGMGFPFEVRLVEVDESFDGIPAHEASPYLAEKKARAYEDPGESALIICADTVVIFEGKVLGKPVSRTEGIEMLKCLSGHVHTVSTSVCVREGDKYFVETDEAEVKFRKLSSQEIYFYIDHYKPFDKAGAYGIQEWIGMVGVESIKGSFYTIMGLPTHLVYKLLQPYINHDTLSPGLL